MCPAILRLVVHHDNGYVWVGDVTGDLDVTSHTGDMIVILADPGPYAIDARTRLAAFHPNSAARRLTPSCLGGTSLSWIQLRDSESICAWGAEALRSRLVHRPALSGRSERPIQRAPGGLPKGGH